MIINGYGLLSAAPIVDMLPYKAQLNGVSYGLSEVGYDIRLKQDIWFYPVEYAWETSRSLVRPPAHSIDDKDIRKHGNFVLASAMEEFRMPNNLMGVVHDKSTWARQGLSVFNTVIEPGWRGWLTLELVYHGQGDIHIPAGTGIAQVVFHALSYSAAYEGKYQDQADHPVEPILT